ncbi:MAG: ATP-binding protein [Eubacteriales bacterium]|nr:ATP-binding protein [Eubacteriales bacterium]
MLIQFNFKNFKSFRDESTLDMSATKISDFSDRVVSVGKEKILPVAAIFGANAHGKSNVLEAFRFMHLYIIKSFAFGGDSDDIKNRSEILRPVPFLFDADSKNRESLFEVYFIDSEENGAKTYNYGFTLNQDGVNEEWLNYKSKSSRGDYRRIFYRNTADNELDLSGIPQKSQDNIKIALEKETLVVSLGAKLKITKLQHIRDWFINNDFADFGNPEVNFILSFRIPPGFVNDKTVQEKTIKYLSAFDPSITGFNVKVIKDENNKDKKRVEIDAVHKVIGSDKTVSIPLQDESSGTLKMFALYPMLQGVLENGGVLIIDELNSRMHPLLVRSFLLTFTNPEINKNHAQLIFTTHDAWQLNGSGLRRDEIWFTEKDSDGITKLYSLADFADDDGVKIRKDENFEKNYLLGKYGAIPSLKYFDVLGGNEGVTQ